MGDWVPDAKPDWWGAVAKIGKNPVSSIMGIVATGVVGTFLAWGRGVVGAIQTVAFGAPAGSDKEPERLGLAELPGYVATEITTALTIPASDALSAINSVQDTIQSAAAQTGPLEPFVAVLIWSAWILAGLSVLSSMLSSFTPMAPNPLALLFADEAWKVKDKLL